MCPANDDYLLGTNLLSITDYEKLDVQLLKGSTHFCQFQFINAKPLCVKGIWRLFFQNL